MILVSHKSHLYALKKGSSVGEWQFPPKDKNAYPVSTESAQKINDQIDQFSLDASAKSDLKRKVADLTVAGPTAGVLKDAIDASGATEAEKSSIKKSIDSALTFEKDALNKPRALYGDTGISADGRTAYVPTFRGMLFALDTITGHVLWVRDAGAEMVGGVAVDGDTIYVGTKADRLFAINGKTGERLWEFTTRGEVWATPTVDDGTIYATSLDGALYAIDESGKQKWVFTNVGSGIAARPVVVGDAVYVGAFDNKLYSVKKSDGSLNWSFKASNWFWAAPAVQDGVVYAASLDGKVYAVDASTGEKKWAFDAGNAVRAAPVIAGDGLVVGAKNGRLYKLDLATGQPVDGSVEVDLGHKILANLTTDGDSTVYVVASTAVLYVLDVSGALTAPGSYPLPQ